MIKRLARGALLPCIGKLRKGGVKEVKTITKNGQTKEIETYGKDLTFFRFDTDDEEAAKIFRAAYGAEPSTINVYLPYQTAEQNFTCWQEAYLAGGLTHRCDGETCVIWLDNGKYRTDPKPCPGGCKEVGRLMVIIPELQRFAYVTAETHSVHDIIRLQENLQAVEFLRGDLRGIPFILKRTPVEISTPTPEGKRVRREKWLLSIEVDPTWAALQLESMRRAALSVNGHTIDESRMLTTIDENDNVEDGEIITPPRTSAPTEPNAIPSRVAEWLATEKPVDAAYAWSLENGACQALPHAKSAMKKVVDDGFGGKLTKANIAEVLTAFYWNRQEKLAEATDAVTVAGEEERPSE